MNPGKLRDRGQLLRLGGTEALTFEKARTIWLCGKETGRKNLFSKVGIGASGAEFLLRSCDLTLHDAILWRGQHYFLTDIAREGLHPVYFKVQAARITPKTVSVLRDTVEKDELNRPKRKTKSIGSFPGCVTEKYLGELEAIGHLESKQRVVVVAPKAVQAKVGDLFVISGSKYRVMVLHDLEEFKNEYEIERTEDD